MNGRRGGLGPTAVSGLGAVLFVVAAVHHGRELVAIDAVAAPVGAFLLEGLPALGLVYAGYWLGGRDLPADHGRRVAAWTAAGGAVFAATIGVSMGIRLAEGRTVTEPVFTLLLSASVGSVAGFVGGYYRFRSVLAARRSEQTAKALAFVNGVIRHDLRNDLQVVQGKAYMVEREAGSDSVAAEATAVQETAEQAADRIESTQRIADALTGSTELEPVDLAAVADDVVTQARSLHEATVTADLPESAPVVANDGLRSVVDNLVENAIEHNDSADPEVEVTVANGADTARLAVRDNGPGLSDSQRETLFERPEAADPGGLQIVQTLVREYGGDLAVEDADPRGSRFVVRLPAADAAG